MRLPMMTLCLAAAFAVTGCSREAAPTGAASAPEGRADPVAAVVEHDPFSYAEPARVRIEDLALELAMDFDARTLSGSATYTLDWRDESARELVLDTRDLAIDKVVGERGDGKWQDLEYSLAEADPRLGSKLTIHAPDRNPRIRGPAVADSGDDRWRGAALHVQPVAADPRPLLGAAAGHPAGALHLHRARHQPG